MDFFVDYLEEIILLVGIVVLRLFGRKETAEKLAKKRLKRKKKLTKKCNKEARKLEKDYKALKDMDKEVE